VPAHCSYDYALIRVVPRVERGEFVNVGAILCCAQQDYLNAAVELDEARLRALDPGVDLELVRAHLQSFIVICRGGAEALAIGKLTPRQRFDWLVAPRSTVIQTSAVHSGRSGDPAAELEHVMRTMVRAPQP
jgi:Protein of unknown function (DUF3037)